MFWPLLSVLLLAVGSVGALERDPPGKGFEYVTCGSAVRLAHVPTDFRLHSHKVAYGSGSKQQSVTMIAGVDDVNSLWQVHGDLDNTCVRGSKIKCGKNIRLQHVATQAWLHSHDNHRSPLSSNQEVSALGDNDHSDMGDSWRLECDTTHWEREHPVRFKHQQTNQYLHSTGQHQYNQPIAGQREVCAAARANNLNLWRAAEGLYIKSPDAQN